MAGVVYDLQAAHDSAAGQYGEVPADGYEVFFFVSQPQSHHKALLGEELYRGTGRLNAGAPQRPQLVVLGPLAPRNVAQAAL